MSKYRFIDYEKNNQSMKPSPSVRPILNFSYPKKEWTEDKNDPRTPPHAKVGKNKESDRQDSGIRRKRKTRKTQKRRLSRDSEMERFDIDDAFLIPWRVA